MKFPGAPCSISDAITFPDISKDVRSYELKGGLFKDTQHAWVSCGPVFNIIEVENGRKVAGHIFNANSDFRTEVTCVEEIPPGDGSRKISQCLVGVSCEIINDMICLFDIALSRVLRTVCMSSRVNSLSIIEGGSNRYVGQCSLPSPLNCMSGIVAAGLEDGSLLIIDINQFSKSELMNIWSNDHQERIYNEENPCQIMLFTTSDDVQDVELKRIACNESGDHLTLMLNDKAFIGENFLLLGPGGHPRRIMPRKDVSVTSLLYIRHTVSLVVGLNVSCFQIWNLMSLNISFTSSLMVDPLPIVHLGFQEPSDDPSNFCYLWAVHGSTAGNSSSRPPLGVMYALCYESKCWIEGYGYHYQDFRSCSLRLEYVLPVNSSSPVASCSCLSFSTLNSTTLAQRNLNDDEYEDVASENMSICVFAWKANDAIGKPLCTCLALFDLNQWYKDQMPSRLDDDDDDDDIPTCLVTFSLQDIWTSKEEDSRSTALLDIRVDPQSVCQFRTFQNLEEHFQPSALSFASRCLLGDQVMFIAHPGVQRYLLSHMEQEGPLSLMEPKLLFRHCQNMGLKPILIEMDVGKGFSLMELREYLLSVALENENLRFLLRCAMEWANGSQSMAGCTLPMFLYWGWQRATVLKEHADNICIPLFDCSGGRLDKNELCTLNNCSVQLHHLATLFQGISSSKAACILQCNEDLKQKTNALKLVATYFRVLQWFLNVGLLPEFPEDEADDDDEMLELGLQKIPYPISKLNKIYKHRRKELEEMSARTGTHASLFIDALLSHEENAEGLVELWQQHGGTGHYPPPSLQCLLATYLLEGIATHVKHAIVIYVFLDLAALLDTDKYGIAIDYFIKFPSAVCVAAGIIKVTQAFWLFDQKNFEEGLDMILDPLVSPEDLQPWQHHYIVQAFICQGQYKHALVYYEHKPFTHTLEDVRTKITLLVTLGHVTEANRMQRDFSKHPDYNELLEHFFKECEKEDQLGILIKLQLFPREEEAFIHFLESSKHPRAADMCVLYYLMRSRIVEAIEMNNKINLSTYTRQRDDKSVRDLLVNAYAKTLPGMTQKLVHHCTVEKKAFTNWKQVVHPTPLSVNVCFGNDPSVREKSSLIHATVEKSREIQHFPTVSCGLGSKAKDNAEMASLKSMPLVRDCQVGVSSRDEKSSVSISLKRLHEDQEESSALKKRPRLDDALSDLNLDRAQKKGKKYLHKEISTFLSSPFVERLTPRLAVQKEQAEGTGSLSAALSSQATPQSILKVRKQDGNIDAPEGSSVATALKPSHEKGRTIPAVRQIRFSLPAGELQDSLPVCSSVGVATSPAKVSSVLTKKPSTPTPRNVPNCPYFLRSSTPVGSSKSDVDNLALSVPSTPIAPSTVSYMTDSTSSTATLADSSETPSSDSNVKSTSRKSLYGVNPRQALRRTWVEGEKSSDLEKLLSPMKQCNTEDAKESTKGRQKSSEKEVIGVDDRNENAFREISGVLSDISSVNLLGSTGTRRHKARKIYYEEQEDPSGESEIKLDIETDNSQEINTFNQEVLFKPDQQNGKEETKMQFTGSAIKEDSGDAAIKVIHINKKQKHTITHIKARRPISRLDNAEMASPHASSVGNVKELFKENLHKHIASSSSSEKEVSFKLRSKSTSIIDESSSRERSGVLLDETSYSFYCSKYVKGVAENEESSVKVSQQTVEHAIVKHTSHEGTLKRKRETSPENESLIQEPKPINSSISSKEATEEDFSVESLMSKIESIKARRPISRSSGSLSTTSYSFKSANSEYSSDNHLSHFLTTDKGKNNDESEDNTASFSEGILQDDSTYNSKHVMTDLERTNEMNESKSFAEQAYDKQVVAATNKKDVEKQFVPILDGKVKDVLHVNEENVDLASKPILEMEWDKGVVNDESPVGMHIIDSCPLKVTDSDPAIDNGTNSNGNQVTSNEVEANTNDPSIPPVVTQEEEEITVVRDIHSELIKKESPDKEIIELDAEANTDRIEIIDVESGQEDTGSESSVEMKVYESLKAAEVFSEPQRLSFEEFGNDDYSEIQANVVESGGLLPDLLETKDQNEVSAHFFVESQENELQHEEDIVIVEIDNSNNTSFERNDDDATCPLPDLLEVQEQDEPDDDDDDDVQEVDVQKVEAAEAENDGKGELPDVLLKTAEISSNGEGIQEISQRNVNQIDGSSKAQEVNADVDKNGGSLFDVTQVPVTVVDDGMDVDCIEGDNEESHHCTTVQGGDRNVALNLMLSKQLLQDKTVEDEMAMNAEDINLMKYEDESCALQDFPETETKSVERVIITETTNPVDSEPGSITLQRMVVTKEKPELKERPERPISTEYESLTLPDKIEIVTVTTQSVPGSFDMKNVKTMQTLATTRRRQNSVEDEPTETVEVEEIETVEVTETAKNVDDVQKNTFFTCTDAQAIGESRVHQEVTNSVLHQHLDQGNEITLNTKAEATTSKTEHKVRSKQKSLSIQSEPPDLGDVENVQRNLRSRRRKSSSIQSEPPELGDIVVDPGFRRTNKRKQNHAQSLTEKAGQTQRRSTRLCRLKINVLELSDVLETTEIEKTVGDGLSDNHSIQSHVTGVNKFAKNKKTENMDIVNTALEERKIDETNNAAVFTISKMEHESVDLQLPLSERKETERNDEYCASISSKSTILEGPVSDNDSYYSSPVFTRVSKKGLVSSQDAHVPIKVTKAKPGRKLHSRKQMGAIKEEGMEGKPEESEQEQQLHVLKEHDHEDEMSQYATARRLTRHQRSLLERSMELSKASKCSSPPRFRSGRPQSSQEDFEDSNDESEASSIATRSSRSRYSTRLRERKKNLSPSSASQLSPLKEEPLQASEQTPVKRKGDIRGGSPTSVHSEKSVGYASSVTSSHSQRLHSPGSTQSGDGLRLRRKSFQKAQLSLISSPMKTKVSRDKDSLEPELAVGDHAEAVHESQTRRRHSVKLASSQHADNSEQISLPGHKTQIQDDGHDTSDTGSVISQASVASASLNRMTRSASRLSIVKDNDEDLCSFSFSSPTVVPKAAVNESEAMHGFVFSLPQTRAQHRTRLSVLGGLTLPNLDPVTEESSHVNKEVLSKETASPGEETQKTRKTNVKNKNKSTTKKVKVISKIKKVSPSKEGPSTSKQSAPIKRKKLVKKRSHVPTTRSRSRQSVHFITPVTDEEKMLHAREKLLHDLRMTPHKKYSVFKAKKTLSLQYKSS